MLFSGIYWVLKRLEFMFDISRQGNVDCDVLVVPCHRETTILGTRPISCDFVLSANHRHEVVDVFFSFVFDAKVINKKSESCGAPSVHG